MRKVKPTSDVGFKIIMEGEKENTNFETPEEAEKEELLSEKALEDDLELDEELDRLPI